MGALLASGLLPGRITVDSEFQVPGIFTLCGQATAAMAESYGLQSYVSTPSMYQQMRAAGRSLANSSTYMSHLQAQLEADKFRVARIPGGTFPSVATWKPWALARLNEGAPVAVEASHAQVVDSAGRIIAGWHDLITGGRMDAGNLDYHYALMCGYWAGGVNPHAGKFLPEGFWFADPDSDATNPVVGGVRKRVVNGSSPQYYALADVAASRLYDLMAVYPRVAIYTGAAGGANVKIPTGWTDDGALLKSPNGVAAEQGFRNAILHAGEPGAIIAESWNPDNWILRPEYGARSVEPGNPAIGEGTRLDCRWTSLGWTTTRNVYRIYAGQDVLALEAQVAALEAKLDKVRADIAA